MRYGSNRKLPPKKKAKKSTVRKPAQTVSLDNYIITETKTTVKKTYVPSEMARSQRYGQSGRTRNKRMDALRTAKKPGWRKSSSGRWYFETRRNRSDTTEEDAEYAKLFPILKKATKKPAKAKKAKKSKK